MRLPRRFTPDKTSSVVEVAPNAFAILLSSERSVSLFAVSMRRQRDFKIIRTVDIGNETRVRRSPSELFLRLRAGGRAVDGDKVRKPAEVVGGFVGGFAGDGQAKPAPNDFGDFSESNAFIADTV